MDSSRFRQYFRIICCLWLTACVAVFVVESMHWKLVGDPAEVQFACQLMDRGMSPYRDILDNQMPGTYMVSEAVTRTVGSSDLAWRLFDLSLLAVATLAMFSIARRYDWFGAAFAAGMFMLLHGHGGDEQLGQRDLIIAVFLLLGYGFLFHAVRANRRWPMLLVGFFVAAAGTIKPTALGFLLVLLPVAGIWIRSRKQPVVRGILLALAGAAIPMSAVVVFLESHGSMPAFLHTVFDVLPFFAQIGRKSIPEMLRTSKTIPLIGALLGFGVVIAWLRRDWTWETGMLVLGAAFGAAHYFSQGKGFAYHRYPFLAFAMLWLGIQLAEGLRKQGATRVLAYAGLLLGMVCAGQFTVHGIRTPEWGKEYRAALTPDLVALGGPALSGHIQCVTTSSDCDMVLLRMHLVQATGLLYDFMIFGDDTQPVIQEMRQRAWTQWQHNPPRIVVVGPFLFGKHPCEQPPGERTDAAKYAKLQTWPQLDQTLTTQYTLVRDVSWPATDAPCEFTMGYRIYTMR